MSKSVLNLQQLQKMQQLKPCPFCGADGKLVNIPDCNGSLNWAVICGDIRCKVCPCTSYHETEQEAVDAWNTRAERTCEIEKAVFGYECNKCHERIFEAVNYCPNCGARVVE